jgi:hypothetical protein
MQHPRPKPVEVEPARLVERDQVAIELDALRQAAAQLGQQVAHLPPSAAAGVEGRVRADEAAEPVQLRLEHPAAPGRNCVGAGEHRFGQPQHHRRRQA